MELPLTAGGVRESERREPSGLRLFNAVLVVRWASLAVASVGYTWNHATGGDMPYGSFLGVAALAILYTLVLTLFSPQIYAWHRRSVAFLLVEGGALAVGRGDCPVGPLQAEWGDPVPFFELVLPPRAAKAAVPVLTIVSVAGMAALVLRRPGLAMHAAPRGAA